MRFLEQPRQHARKSVLLIEEACPTYANRHVSSSRKRFRKRRLVERESRFRGGGAPAELRGEQARMRSNPERCRQESGKKRLMRRIGKTRGAMPLLPSIGREIG